MAEKIKDRKIKGLSCWVILHLKKPDQSGNDTIKSDGHSNFLFSGNQCPRWMQRQKNFVIYVLRQD